MDAISRQLARANHALEAGRAEQAFAIAREMVRKHPRAAEPLDFLGRLYCMIDKPSAALPYLRRAAAAASENPQTRQTLAHALAETGLLEEAIATAREAVELERRRGGPTYEGQILLGCLCGRAGRLDEAEACFALAVELLWGELAARENDPELKREAAAAYNNLGNVRCELGRREEAVECYYRAVQLAPDFADAWANAGVALLPLGLTMEAARVALRALKLRPTQTAAWLTLGNAMSELGRWAAARRAFDTLLTLDPMSLAARYNRSLADLALGKWSAWGDYRLRHAVQPTVGIDSGLPRWAGESLADRTVLVRREQGVGTQIMFSGYLPALANLAGRVIVECDPRLKPLFERTMPGIEFAPRRELFEADENAAAGGGKVSWRVERPDVEVAIGDLPGLLRPANNVSNWAAGVAPPSVTPNVGLVRKWRDRLSRLGGGLCVGISWRGGGTAVARQKRSTTLDLWSPVLALPGVHFVSLQYGDCRDELSEHARRGGAMLREWDDFDPAADLDDLAALAAALDLVVSIDNSTAHLAGAVGAKTWLLLPAAADWRWLIGRADTPWYPTATLLRQREEPAGWPELFAEVAGRLGQFAAEQRRAAPRVG